MRLCTCLPFVAALAACSGLGSGSKIESSVILAENGRVQTTMRTDGTLTVDLRGLGPGAVTFDACTRDGTVMAHGVLTPESTAQCHTSDGELVITFAADARGGSVGYVIRTTNGGSVTTIPQ